MAQFPVTVKALSRFQSKAESAETLRQLAAGEVDVLVGTHRLLQPTTRFKDLGLVVVDEEQRFGVEHKEYLKTMRSEEHTSELQSRQYLVCRLLLEKKKNI